jgi:hypothetical protein
MVRPQYLFLPIHPELAIAILQGRKKWELRTKSPAIDSGDVVVLYATAPSRRSSAASSQETSSRPPESCLGGRSRRGHFDT